MRDKIIIGALILVLILAIMSPAMLARAAADVWVDHCDSTSGWGGRNISLNTSGKKEGTGLGTHSAVLVARNHQGDIHFTTSENEGTHMVVELPVDLNERR